MTSTMSRYDPPAELPKWTTVGPRAFVPLLPPPEPLHWPVLPSPARQAAFSESYTLSTHIIPAAYPRVSPDFPPPERITDPNISKDERKRIITQRAEELLVHKLKQVTHRKAGTPLEGGQKILWNCINRYYRKDLKEGEARGLTLFFAHANGFHKEVGFVSSITQSSNRMPAFLKIWEPTLRHLLSKKTGLRIDEIWTWEAVNHGDSSLINEKNLSGLCMCANLPFSHETYLLLS